MEELKHELAECAASMSLEELTAAINESAVASLVDDPQMFAAYLKTLA